MPTPADHPTLAFDAWVALSASLMERGDFDKLELLAEADLALDDWRPIDRHYQDLIRADVLGGRLERPQRYGAACAAELKRREEQASAPVAVDEPTAPAPPAPPAPPVHEPALPPAAHGGLVAQAPASSPGDTHEMKVLRRESAGGTGLPFVPAAQGAVAWAVAPPTPAPTPDPRSGATMPLGVQMPIPGRALPFEQKAQQAPAPLRQLGLKEHAALSAELSLHPERTEEILHRWGIVDPRARATLDAEWQQHLASHPPTRVEWQRAFEHYKAWLLQQRR